MDPPGPAAPGRHQAPRPGGVTHRYQQRRAGILEFELRPGRELEEAALAERFGRSRTAVREALVNRPTERLVELLPDGGVRAARFESLEPPRFIEAIDLVSRAINRYAAERRSADQPAGTRTAHGRFTERTRDPEAGAGALVADNRALQLVEASAAGDADAAEAVARSRTAIFRERVAGRLAATGTLRGGDPPRPAPRNILRGPVATAATRCVGAACRHSMFFLTGP